VSSANAGRSIGSGGAITDDDLFWAPDPAPALTDLQKRQALGLAQMQRVEFIIAAATAEAAGDLVAAAAWDRLEEQARQRVEAAYEAVHGRASEILMGRIVSVRVLDPASRKRCKQAFKMMSAIEQERTK
jgi:hypothetical protein